MFINAFKISLSTSAIYFFCFLFLVASMDVFRFLMVFVRCSRK